MSKDKIIDHYGLMKFHLEYEDQTVPAIIDYEDEKKREKIINANEIIIEDEKITIEFTYPLSVKVTVECKQKKEFTRMNLFELIYEEYKIIYEEEAEVGDPGAYESLYNRKRSQGKCGIWGHFLEDLCIESLRYDAKN